MRFMPKTFHSTMSIIEEVEKWPGSRDKKNIPICETFYFNKEKKMVRMVNKIIY